MFERPIALPAVQQARVNRLKVTVNIPVYNEDPLILDRALYALFTQTLLPDRVEVVDDGSTRDYSEVRAYWQQRHPSAGGVSWVLGPKQRKKEGPAPPLPTPAAGRLVT